MKKKLIELFLYEINRLKLEESIGKYLIPQFADLMKHFKKHADGIFEKNQVSICFNDFILIRHIIFEQGISQKELAEKIMFDKGSVSKFILRLENMGIVERLLSPKDKRFRKLFVTEKGKAEFENALKHVAGFNEKIQKDIAKEEFETVTRVLKKLKENINIIANKT